MTHPQFPPMSGPRRTVAASLLVLALGAMTALAPAAGVARSPEDPASYTLPRAGDDVAARGAQTAAPFLPDSIDPDAFTRGGSGTGETSATVQEGAGVGAAKKPAILRRSQDLFMSSLRWDTPIAPGQDTSYVRVVQEPVKKRITVTVDFDAVPSAAANSIVWVYLGKWDAKEDNCIGTGKGVQIGAITHHTSASEAASVDLVTKKPSGTATRALSGSKLTITVNGGVAANSGYDCTFAYVDGLPENHPANQPLPELLKSVAENFVAEYEKAPEFDLSTSALHAAYPKKWNTISITVRNTGNKAATKTKITFSAKKTKFKAKTISLGTIKAGARKTVKVRVKLTGKSTRTLAYKVRSTGGWTASGKTKVGYRPNATKVKSLAGRSYWGTKSRSYSGWNVYGLTFVDKRWVYVGVPPKGTPKCSTKVKQCKRYTYNAKKGTFKIGKSTGKVNSEGVTFKKIRYTPLQNVKKGARYGITLSYYDYTGCEGSYSCSTWWQYLTLKKNGTFSWSYEAIHSSGMPPNQMFVSISRPTKKGTYKALSKSRMSFTYVDAETGKKKTEVHTVRIDQNALGKYSVKHGLLIGNDPYSR